MAKRTSPPPTIPLTRRELLGSFSSEDPQYYFRTEAYGIVKPNQGRL